MRTAPRKAGYATRNEDLPHNPGSDQSRLEIVAQEGDCEFSGAQEEGRMEMKKPIDYLKLYGDRFYLTRLEDRTVEIRTKFKVADTRRDWCSVYLFSDTHLGVILPRRVGYRLQREMPDTFKVHQDADDGVAMLFEESRLQDLTDTLKLRRRRRPMTPEQEEHLSGVRQEGLRRLSEMREASTRKAQNGS